MAIEALKGAVSVLSVMGVVMVLEGIPYFGFPKAVKGWASYLHQLSERNLRFLGLGIMATGLILLYAIRSL